MMFVRTERRAECNEGQVWEGNKFNLPANAWKVRGWTRGKVEVTYKISDETRSCVLQRHDNPMPLPILTTIRSQDRQFFDASLPDDVRVYIQPEQSHP